jgi:multidrug efflux pump subunit AcrA (membrane-fusion protein)
VTIDLPQTEQAFMRPGMRANARIVVRRIKGAVTVPAECIFQHGRGRVVYAERDGRYQRIAIQVGASNGDYTQIVRGLKQGDRIALNDLEASAAPAAAAPAREATRP